MKEVKLFPSTELMGAIAINSLTSKQIERFAEDPYAAVALTGADLSDLSIVAVENTAEVIHLALPYYEALDGTSAQAVSDDDLDAIVGGEIIITLSIVGTGLALTALSVGFKGVAAGMAVAGVVAGVAVAGAVAGGVAGGIEVEKGK